VAFLPRGKKKRFPLYDKYLLYIVLAYLYKMLSLSPESKAPPAMLFMS
jgi:hypothetical protein